MTEFPSCIGIGSGDLALAAEREVRQLLKEAGGNRDRALILSLNKLVEMDLITEEELKIITEIHEIGFSAARGRMDAREAHLRCRAIADEMLAAARHTPVALALAYGETNSYVSIVEDADGTPTVAYSKKRQSWESSLSEAGTIIGGLLGGVPGALAGQQIGKAVGKIVDACTDEE